MATDAPPEASKPRPDPGPRAQRLQQVHAASLGKTLDKLSWDNFTQCYPVASSRAESTMRRVHTQMVEQLRRKCEREFDSILDTRDVVARLNELERLADDAANRREAHSEELEVPTPPHLLPPSKIVDAHLATLLSSHREALLARLESTQVQNALLSDTVRKQRADIQELLGGLDAAVEDVRAANKVLAKGGLVNTLAKEATDVDKELEALE